MANFNKIRILAKEKKVSLSEIADAVGITQQGLSIIMRENITRTNTIEAIAKYLQVPVGYFFDEAMPTGTVISSDILEMIRKKDERIQELTDMLLKNK